MDAVRMLLSVLLVVVGAVYPLAAIYRLAVRMNRAEAKPLAPLGVLFRLLLIATIPLAGILGGFAGLVPGVWASPVLRAVIGVATVASVVGIVALLTIARWREGV